MPPFSPAERPDEEDGAGEGEEPEPVPAPELEPEEAVGPAWPDVVEEAIAVSISCSALRDSTEDLDWNLK